MGVIGAWETRQWAQDGAQDEAIEEMRLRMIDIHTNQARYGERLKALESRTNYLVKTQIDKLGMDDKRW